MSRAIRVCWHTPRLNRVSTLVFLVLCSLFRWIAMTSAVICLSGARAHPSLPADLEAAGVQVLAVVQGVDKLVHNVVQLAPNVVVLDEPDLSDSLFKHTQALASTAPCPVLLLTSDSDADRMAQALDAGVHAYVVNGYASNRARALVQLAQARFRRDKVLADALADVTTRFEERKVVDRAKGILMHARQVSDDDAFRMLRTAAMQSNQRLGQVSAHIVQSARFADSVNRSGQLRMLSQRLVKLYVLQLAGVQVAQHKQGLKASVQRIDANLALLDKNVSKATFGGLLEPVVASWGQLKRVAQSTPQVSQLQPLDDLAERLLQDAERLTRQLEHAGAVAPLQVLNQAGRQRMLSQRCAKLALLSAVGGTTPSQQWQDTMAEAQAEFERTLAYLGGLPLSTVEIRNGLDAATAHWHDMLLGVREAGQPVGRERVAVASESLLEVFETLSDHYARSMQTLVG